ncbi:hypothetical protein BDN72DRAFT_815901 [Pluteus cervinus]|uniref:Uncharacterized protein n=1 Tax=Pluteus cervinus TaxID=181527 RepID=A0ACD3B6H2_9AGAR|nr:hypothetical protein BDN72DRAFT_815901 [Pluteus cervinus]
MDIQHQHGTDIYVLRACLNDDALGLVAIGGEHSVEVILISDTSARPLASFHIGSRITAIAWSPRAVSPASAADWTIELAAAGEDYGLYLLTKSSKESETIFPFGGGLSGHHGKVNDITFCGGRSEDSARYVATVSDDKMLMVWDLYPTIDIPTNISSPIRSLEERLPLSPAARPQPTAYVIPFSHPLTTICSHPSTSKEFLVADARGSIFLTDWRSDPEDNAQDGWRKFSVIELNEPHALANSSIGHHYNWSGSIAWRRDTPDIIGGVYGSRFSLWDTSNLHGGKPFANGTSFLEGGHHFRWCPTYPEYFAISTQNPAKGAVINVHNVNYIHAQATAFAVGNRPHFVRDFDFLGLRGIPRIAAAVGQKVWVFSIGVES